jgi:hypothetical protein
MDVPDYPDGWVPSKPAQQPNIDPNALIFQIGAERPNQPY